METNFITAAEIARRLDCSVSNVNYLLRHGTIAGQRTASGWKIKKEDFEKYFGDYVTIETATKNTKELKDELERLERDYKKRITYLIMQFSAFDNIICGIQYLFQTYQTDKDCKRCFKISDLFYRGMHNVTAEISEEWGLTQERTRQIVNRELRRFFHYLYTLPKYKTITQENEALKIKLELSEQVNRRILKHLNALNEQAAKEAALNNLPVCARKVTEFDLSIRALNCLRAADIETVGDLINYSKRDLMRFRNFGKKSLIELEDFVESLGLEFSNVNKISW